MKLELNHLNKSALAAILFICVYHVFSLMMQGALFVSFVFLCAAIYCAYILINEQNISKKAFNKDYAYLVIVSWLALYLLLFTTNNQTSSLGVWFCILILCTSILLSPAHSLRLNAFVLLLYWVFAFFESGRTFFIFIESALALTVVFLLSGIVQKVIFDLDAKLNIAKETDSLTGCIQSGAFKDELEKVVQLYDRYKTPFSIIRINYQSHFDTEGDLQIWLKELAHLYQSRLRKTDVLCRFNSQKFMILLPSTNIKNAEALSLDLENCVKAYEFSFKRKSSAVSTSPTLVFSSETFIKNQKLNDWFEKIQS